MGSPVRGDVCWHDAGLQPVATVEPSAASAALLTSRELVALLEVPSSRRQPRGTAYSSSPIGRVYLVMRHSLLIGERPCERDHSHLSCSCVPRRQVPQTRVQLTACHAARLKQAKHDAHRVMAHMAYLGKRGYSLWCCGLCGAGGGIASSHSLCLSPLVPARAADGTRRQGAGSCNL